MPRYDLDSAVYQKGFKKLEEQQRAFLKNKYHYPARPKNQWELGIFGGSSLISGDIREDFTKGWGGGFTVRKAINYFFSIRFSYMYSHIQAQEYQPRTDMIFEPTLILRQAYAPAGTTVANEKSVFHNYRNLSHQVHIEGVVNLGNIRYHKERTIAVINLFFGGGAHMYRTQTLMLDKNGKAFDYSVPLTYYYSVINNTSVSDATRNKTVREDLDKIQAGGQWIDITQAQKSGGKVAKYYVVPDFTIGGGLLFHVSKLATLGIEERFTYNSNSTIDGVQYQSDTHPSLATHYDQYFSTTIHLNFQIGRNSVEPLWWLNPMDYAYKRISEANPDKIAKDLLKDTDEDGVPDRLDKEPNTKKGCPVDVKGVILDSDKDGIPDCDDKEPFSPPGYPIDSNGVAQVPPNPCCDNDTSGFGPGVDGTNAGGPNGNGNNGINGTGGNGPNGGGGPGGKGRNRRGGGYDCSKIEMPGVFFDDDKYYIDPAYQSALHQVAEKLQMCPDVKMIITGIDESRNDQKYNEQLAYNRASTVVDYLVEKYGISRDRFIVKYEGGKKSDAAKTPQERKKGRRVDINYAGDSEQGESNPPAPHPGLKAGSNK